MITLHSVDVCGFLKNNFRIFKFNFSAILSFKNWENSLKNQQNSLKLIC